MGGGFPSRAIPPLNPLRNARFRDVRRSNPHCDGNLETGGLGCQPAARRSRQNEKSPAPELKHLKSSDVPTTVPGTALLAHLTSWPEGRPDISAEQVANANAHTRKSPVWGQGMGAIWLWGFGRLCGNCVHVESQGFHAKSYTSCTYYHSHTPHPNPNPTQIQHKPNPNPT